MEELRALVAALHDAGIEVVLDVVFNHSGEKDGLPADPVYSLGGVDPETYYLIDARKRHYFDATGCGNTVACNEPAVVDLLVDALRFWVGELGVDRRRLTDPSSSSCNP